MGGACVDLLTKSVYAVESARLVHLCFTHSIMCNHVKSNIEGVTCYYHV